jgi:hypothetical protein
MPMADPDGSPHLPPVGYREFPRTNLLRLDDGLQSVCPRLDGKLLRAAIGTPPAGRRGDGCGLQKVCSDGSGEGDGPLGMPELQWQWGDPLIMAVMLGAGRFLYYKFKRSGWL